MVELAYIGPGVAVVAAAAGLWFVARRWGRGWRWGARGVATGLVLVAAVPLVVGLLILSGRFRARPAAVDAELFQGVRYERVVLEEPRPMVAHVVTIDLRTPGLRFRVTPAEPDGKLPARRTSDYLRKTGASLAINANYFSPFHDDSAWDYYPHSGDRVSVIGAAASDGAAYGDGRRGDAIVNIAPDNRVRVGPSDEPLHNAVAGGHLILINGEVTPDGRRGPYPRTILGVNAGGDRLTLLVVDGKQPGYSEGATPEDAAGLLRDRGVRDAVALDEGGSSTLACRGAGGSVAVLNSPCHTRVPGRERPVANHLAVFVEEQSR